MKNFCICFTILFSFIHPEFSIGQAPLIKSWDRRFGGNNFDEVASFQQTLDGGYILGGWSLSGFSGEKTQNTWGDEDFWIVKIDSLSNKIWDLDFGGYYGDYLKSLVQTSDGGYLLAGNSYSSISGDKTEPSWGASDFWIIRIDSSGNKLWDKDIGGFGFDQMQSMKQTDDGGFIIGGYSMSGIGGNKSQGCWGLQDYWIVKIDSLGNVQWDKDFGGTNDDLLFSIVQTADHGFLAGGWSFSGISGDKTQPNLGNQDYWILKIDSNGTKQWDKNFGGTGEDWLTTVLVTKTGELLIGGYSKSGISGDKTQANWDTSGNSADIWILKLDPAGNKIWDKDFGGVEWENNLGSIKETIDGNFLLSISSGSYFASGDKTENNIGSVQTWLMLIDSAGNKIWDKTIVTGCYDKVGYAIQTNDGGFAITSHNESTSCVAGGFRSQPSWNNSPDYWIVKFADTTFSTGMYVPEETKQLSLYPSPVTNVLTIDFSNSTASADIRIYNLMGDKIFSSVARGQVNVDCQSFSTGIYIVEVCSFEKIQHYKFYKN